VAERLAGYRADLEGASRWPLAERFDHAPEASWGPREVLAHLASTPRGHNAEIFKSCRKLRRFFHSSKSRAP